MNVKMLIVRNKFNISKNSDSFKNLKSTFAINLLEILVSSDPTHFLYNS